MTALLKKPGGQRLASRFVGRIEAAAAGLDREFPDRYAETKKTLAAHLAAAREMLGTKGRARSSEGRVP
jgi:hypothetical protein